MATLDELVVKGVLRRVDSGKVLASDQQAFRSVYYSMEVHDWISNKLPHIQTDGYIQGALSPREQALSALQEFISGCSPDLFDMPPVRLNPQQLGVWELRTADLRFFGVFPVRDKFLWASACTKSQAMKENNFGYEYHRDETLKFIKDLDLNQPKKLLGEKQDVLTF